MTAPNIRLVDQLKSEASTYAKALGISLNALVAVAVREYLDARKSKPLALQEPSDAALAASPARPVPLASPGQPGTVQKSATERTWRLAAAKVGRNDPCPCGSGKKAKQCHGGAV